MIGIAQTFTKRTLRMAMGGLALIGVAAAVPASAHPWRDHGRYDGYGYGYRHDEGRDYGYRHEEGRGWGYGWHRHADREWRYRPMYWHHERWR